MTVDPRVGFWFSIVMAIVSALGICGTQLTTLFGDVMANKILAAIVMLNVINGAINAILHAIPAKAGAPASEFPLGPKAVPVILLALILGSFAFPSDAMAQAPRLVRPTGNIVQDIAAATGSRTTITGAPVTDIQNFLNAKFLPDLQYALKLATASKNTITADCYQAWIDIINTQQTAVTNPDGSPLAMPDPHVITEFEKLVELRNALQPESPFMVKCSPVASMVKLDIAKFMGVVIAGGAGLATMVPGL